MTKGVTTHMATTGSVTGKNVRELIVSSLDAVRYFTGYCNFTSAPLVITEHSSVKSDQYMVIPRAFSTRSY
jgi:hypothetical protein